MRITIETGTPDEALESSPDGDWERVAALHAASWRTAYAGILPDSFLAGPLEAERRAEWHRRLTRPPAGSALILATGEQVADGLYGFAYLMPGEGGRILLDNLHVRPGHLGSGIGGVLLREALSWAARAHPGRDVYLEVLRDNTRAIAFYERQGGVRTGEDVARFGAGIEVPQYLYTWPWPRPSKPAPASAGDAAEPESEPGPGSRRDGSSSIQASTARS